MTIAAHRAAWLTAIGASLVALTAAGWFVLAPSELTLAHETRARIFVGGECLAGVLWLWAIALVQRHRLPARALWIVLTAAFAMRAIAFAAPPLLSSDMYRYVWDGRVQRAGINPYRYLPAAPELEVLRDDAVYPLINRADYARTIYPPFAEMVFAAAAFVVPGIYGMKAMMAGFDLLALLVLLRLLRLLGRDPAEVLIYAWLPLPVWEFAGNAHVDAIAAGLLTLALLAAAYRRAVATGIVLAAATLTKFLPGVVLPAFWRYGDWRLPVAFMLALAAFYAPYLGVGWHVFGFLGGYADEEDLGSGAGIFLLQWLGWIVPLPAWSGAAYGILVLAILAVVSLRISFGAPLPSAPAARVAVLSRGAAALAGIVLVALSPHYEWYVSWLAPLACLASLLSLCWLLAAAPLLALGPMDHWPIPVAVYVPTAALAMLDIARIRRNDVR